VVQVLLLETELQIQAVAAEMLAIPPVMELQATAVQAL
jgi:hypothetical protein